VEDENAGAAAVAQSDVKSYREMTQTATEASAEVTTTTASNKTSTPTKTAEVNTPVQTDEPKYTLFDDSKEMSWPVEGRILMDYSVDTAVYDKTLDQYRTNDSLCIEAAADTEVCAAADGIVEAISNDRVNGNMVVLDHGNGWRTTYSQLRDDINVTEGEVVCKGETVGRVGTPSVYSEALGTHLTFTVSRDNNNIDPKLVLESGE
jgi:murein DD-endopeptidase MepM/ murein hydrolase activator NlpD